MLRAGRAAPAAAAADDGGTGTRVFRVDTGVTRALALRLLQLVLSCVALGVGVALLLDARLGSDGYSMFVSGLSIATGVSFGLVNAGVGVVLVLLAWVRGRRPGVGTLVQAVLVGFVVAWTMPVLPGPDDLVLRWVELTAGFVLVCLGVAGYLAADLGAGPAEGAALAFDPPVPFRWSYTVLQVGGALVGWLCGASLGLGTALVALLVGPVVDRLLRWWRERGEGASLDPWSSRAASGGVRRKAEKGVGPVSSRDRRERGEAPAGGRAADQGSRDTP